jgi:peroxiredoxin
MIFARAVSVPLMATRSLQTAAIRQRSRATLAGLALLVVGAAGCAAPAAGTAPAAGPIPAPTNNETNVPQIGVTNNDGLDVGAAAPDFSLPTADGGSFSLASARAEGPVVLVFFRGHWCPHCRKQLSELEARKADFAAQGAKLVVVSVDGPEDSAKLAEKLTLTLPIASDPKAEVLAAYEVVDVANGIALPATYVIDGAGTVRYLYLGDKAADRPPVDDVLAAVTAAKG